MAVNPKLKQALTLINSLNNEEVSSVIEMIRAKQKQLAREATWSFRIGDEAKFYDRKRYGWIQGTIISRGQKNMKLLVKDPVRGNVTWTVTASLLQKV